ncbi:hypothetical protein K3495_g3639 [Podosphaera aphanis]|nr:hypothetical protein K3495_g3639 [Podosphaera aphanis]
MSLLGRLLSTASVAQSNALDSNLEDQFTYNLLFPDREALSHKDQIFQLKSDDKIDHGFISNFDLYSDLNLEVKDVRVIIMQEATPLSGSAYLLYDSHALPPPPTTEEEVTRSGGRNFSVSPRKSSVDQTSKKHSQSRTQASSVNERNARQSKNFNYTRIDSRRIEREYREEVTSFSQCIFGNSDILAYKGTGTKVHVLPSDKRTSHISSSYAGDGNGSLGRTYAQSNRATQSFNSDTIQIPYSVGYSSPSTTVKVSETVKVLITRMFPVSIPSKDLAYQAASNRPKHGASKNAGYRSPQSAPSETQNKNCNWIPRQKKTPMYAVGLVIQLPLPTASSHAPNSRSSYRGPGSLTDHDSFPSSFNSARRSGWNMAGNGYGMESLDSSVYSELDGRIDVVAKNWDVITRNLSLLQQVASSSLLSMLRKVFVSSNDPLKELRYLKASSSRVLTSGKKVNDDTRPLEILRTNSRMIQLTANCLMSVEKVKNVVELSRQRIVTGIRAQKVITGQGRWGIWRDQARVVKRWAGTKDQGNFLYNLLNAFLGNHTQWLQALGPSRYRRQYSQQQKIGTDDKSSIMDRTVIVSNNKVLARRLIFLLSSFLPSNKPGVSSRYHRPSTSLSVSAHSQSPPKCAIPILRENSLHRKLKKRTGAVRFESSGTLSSPTIKNQETGSFSSDSHLEQNTNDSVSIKTTNLPIPGSDLGARKSSTVIASTATPITTKPHFSTGRLSKGTRPIAHPDNSGSFAAHDLLRLNQRACAVDVDSSSQSPSWGSMISEFWSSSKRVYSGSSNDMSISSVIQVKTYEPSDKHKIQKTQSELTEINDNSNTQPNMPLNRFIGNLEPGRVVCATAEDLSSEMGSDIVAQITRRIPDPSGAYESPVKTTINKDDGIIDIDVPLPDYLDFETAVSSPSSTGYMLTPDLGNCMEFFDQPFRSIPEIDLNMNVGGWLPHYSPDFIVQAVPSQKNIIEEIKASLREEKTPQLAKFTTDTWVDIGSVIVADTITFTVKHIQYQRLIRASKATDTSPEGTDSQPDKMKSSIPQSISQEARLEDRFLEETIKTMDATLTEAVEKIVAQSGQTTVPPPECSSRSSSYKLGGTLHRANSDTHRPFHNRPGLEVPRNECKRIVLSALDDIVRSVAENRLPAESESFLRQNVRTWLARVESND